MIFLDLQHACAERGIQKPFQYLIQNGFSYHTAHRLINNAVDSINYLNLEKLCVLFNCTPNELFSFNPSGEKPVPENHPLRQLSRDANATPIADLMRNIPAHKFKELRETLKNFEK